MSRFHLSAGAAGPALCAAILLATPLTAQQGDGPADDRVTVTPGAHYRAGGLHRFFFGNHYRTLWATPISVPVLDLGAVAGGLTPLKKGGGQQTRSLRFQGADGREFAFRSVDKDPSVILPPELKGTFAQDLLQDQISSSHPAGALVAAPLLAATGIPHSTPILAVMPDDPRLGEFRPEFAGMLGLFEERPTDDDDTRILPGAVRLISTDKLLERTEKGPDDRVDATAFLRARLMDVFLGDWDRHRDQWRWGVMSEAAPRRWLPIPRDRDQAFVRFDGLLLAVARGQAPQLLNFGPGYSNILGATWNGRDLDRRYLTGLEWPVWEATAGELRSLLTDQVIADAVAALPPELAALDSARLAAALRTRRDHLPDAARAWYRQLAEEVDIEATDKAERLEVRATGPGRLRVTLALKDEPTPWFDRTFLGSETGEIRIYLHGGDDEAEVAAPGTSGITVRVIGGGGNQDHFTDPAGAARFYDAGRETIADRGVHLDRGEYAGPPVKEGQLPPRDWGSRHLPLLWLGGGPDVGFLVGGGMMWTDYGFRQQPFASRHTLKLAYATSAREGKVEYTGQFRGENSSVHLDLLALASGIEVLRFSGLGNETSLSGSSRFYRVREILLAFEPAIGFDAGPHTTISVGPTVRWSNTKNGNRFIDQARPYGYDGFGRAGGQLTLMHDTRDVPHNPGKGLLFEAGGSVYPELWDVTSTYGEVHGTAATYLQARGVPTRPVLALRAGARRVFGTAPYQDAAYIGNAETVRLGWENRYGGDAAVWGNVELRLLVGRYRIVVPGQWGIYGLGDLGRVYLDGERSDQWHGAYGGGLWFAPIGRGNTMSIAWAQSAERGKLYASLGFAY